MLNIGRKSRVATETYVERELLHKSVTSARYIFRLCWEGTDVASIELDLPLTSSDAEVDNAGLGSLLRALSTR